MLEAAESLWLCHLLKYLSLLFQIGANITIVVIICAPFLLGFPQYLLYNMDPKVVTILEDLERTSKQQEQKRNEERRSEISLLL